MTLFVLLVMVPTALYVVLSTDWAQEKIKEIAERELSGVLGTEVVIGKVRLTPFSRLELGNVTVADDYGKTALDVKSIDARFEFWNFVVTRRLSFDYAELNGAKIALYKQTSDSPLNIAGILENLKPKKPSTEPTKFDLSVFTVRINDAAFTFDILDKPEKEGFDKNHISLSGLDVIVTAPIISNERIELLLRKMSFSEHKGMKLNNLSAGVLFTPTSLSVSDLVIEMPRTRLDLGDYKFGYDTPSGLSNLFNEIPVEATIQSGSYITPADFAWVVPTLERLENRFDIELQGQFSRHGLNVENFLLCEDSDLGLKLNFKGEATDYNSIDSANFDIRQLELSFTADEAMGILSDIGKTLNPKVTDIIRQLGNVSLSVAGKGSLADASVSVDIATSIGSLVIDASSQIDKKKTIIASAELGINSLDIGKCMSRPDLGEVSAVIEGSIVLEKDHTPYGSVNLVDGSVIYRGELFHDIVLDTEIRPNGDFEGHVEIASDNGGLFANMTGSTDVSRPFINGNLSLQQFNPYELGLTDKYDGYQLGVNIDFDIAGKLGEWIDGRIEVEDLNFVDESGEGLKVKRLSVTADNTVRPNVLTIESDFLNGSLEGQLSPWSIVSEAKEMLSHVLPSLTGDVSGVTTSRHKLHNNFKFNFELANAENLINFFKIPIMVIHPVSIEGSMDYSNKLLLATVDAPYLMKGDMIIEGTTVQVQVDGNDEADNTHAYLTTQFPTKKGEMVIMAGIKAKNDVLNAEFDWNIEREKPVGGKLEFDVALTRMTSSDPLTTTVHFHPSDIRFGGDLWKFSPSEIIYRPGYLSIDNFELVADNQSISINGVSSADEPDSEIQISLDKIVLLSIFETLDINKALIGGTATGVFHAKGLFGQDLSLQCPLLHVDDIGYNRCVLGDADLTANWNNETKSFHLDADIVGDDQRHSHIYGDIYPSTESLDMYFEADRTKVGFMKPFIDAFASDIRGYASGNAHLFGSFKYIDLEGDIYVEDLGVKIDFTNTWYFANDSIHLRPGLIDISDVTVKDVFGHTALLNGRVEHTFFKDPIFDFKVTEAHDFLSYDVTPKLNPDWYGRIFGNGSAFINGRPGVVNIDVDMTTAPDSKFTFVLSDYLEAEEYNFITFRDKNRGVINDSIIEIDDLPEAVREYRNRKLAEAGNQNPPSAYNMNIQVDITPDAQVVLVMDPVGGDEINCHGHGNLRMTYASEGNDLRMFGSYTIERGSYNFTLQDVIVKDFSIKEGSSISFSGDPYSARLDIKAVYTVNANLSDLDESFLQDKELNRTNVPVHALLVVTGDMRQPDIAFDLEFPTLTSDVYRKVRSIISTDEMMNRQIIYLLALNRFYTPEYMSATRGNELFSVASSTLSSRLSSMLGKLSENWTIAPNLRSDRGDFSDVEFDLALSSSLLNNRLRLNGNFGYRDKSLNTNQFIGDFDLEYLLNRAGSWRLKAYNRYNDQNYYLRTAQTTQGVGVMFKRDFDSIFNFRRSKKKDDSQESSSNQQSDDNSEENKPESKSEAVPVSENTQTTDDAIKTAKNDEND